MTTVFMSNNPAQMPNQNLQSQYDAACPSPDKEALISIDAGTPTSHVNVVPTYINGNQFTPAWTGQDETGGSGVVAYDIYASDNGGP